MDEIQLTPEQFYKLSMYLLRREMFNAEMKTRSEKLAAKIQEICNELGMDSKLDYTINEETFTVTPIKKE